MQKLTIEEVSKFFIARGYELLETEYKDNRTKMKYNCPKHPEKDTSISFTHLKQGKGCPYCANRGVVTIEDARQLFTEHGYELTENVYVNNHTLMQYKCPKHPDKELSITYNNLQNNCGCPYCANNVKLNIDFVKEQFAKENYDVLDFEYSGSKEPLHVRCLKTGKINSITWHDFQQGRRCSCCKRTKAAKE